MQPAPAETPAWWRDGQPRLPVGRRIYAIGDLHGRYDLLTALLKRVFGDLSRFPAARPELVFLGDYLSRGSGSAEILDFLVDRAPLLPLPVTMLKGNHEDIALRFLDGNDPLAGAAWMRNGAAAVFASYGLALSPGPHPDEVLLGLAADLRAAMPAAHLQRLRDLKISYQAGDYIFVHGGLKPGVPLAEQTDHDKMWIRDPFLFDRNRHELFVVHGHTPQRLPEIRPNRLNVDTKAYETGALTALVLEGSSRRFLTTL